MRLSIKVVPGASRDEIAGWLGDALKIRVAAPPEKGKANAAVEATLAAALNVPADRVRIIAGHGTSRKVVEVDGLTDQQVRDRLSA